MITILASRAVRCEDSRHIDTDARFGLPGQTVSRAIAAIHTRHDHYAVCGVCAARIIKAERERCNPEYDRDRLPPGLEHLGRSCE